MEDQLSKHQRGILKSSYSQRNIVREDSMPPQATLEELNKVLQKWPSEFDNDLVYNYQRFFILSEKEFRAHRSSRHQLRIVCSHYLMLKRLFRRKWQMANKFDLELRLLPTRLKFQFGQKHVLGIAIAIHLSSPYERFEDQHILLAAQKLLPGVQAVKESFWAYQKPREMFRLLYLEIEKEQNPLFSLSEIRLLKSQMREELKKHVETLSPSTFGNYDVEETMRNIIFLSHELQTPSDLPQIMISFERALATTLVFKVVIVRLLRNKSRPVAECFQDVEGSFEDEHERSSVIGYLASHQKIAKEASVFRLHILKKSSFLRSDFSFNLYHARQYVYSLLTKVFGEIRDYNGGIFSKQLELFAQFKQHFKDIALKDPELLEDFFHSVNPPEMQAIISIPYLVQLFELFLQARMGELPRKESIILKLQKEGEHVFAILFFRNPDFQERIQQSLEENHFSQELIAWLNLKNLESTTLGYIYQSDCVEKLDNFCQTLKKILEVCVDQMQSTQILHLSQEFLPVSLDPRLGGDVLSEAILKMLFEGLMRIGEDGKPHFGIARNVKVSRDGREYTFFLRESIWNNGDRITAYDFCLSWKKILSPDFNSPFAYLFYVIHNAKKAKEGLISLDEIGLEVLDDLTLLVRLEHPCLYFLELVAHPLYSPVNSSVDLMHPNWPLQTGKAYVCNGPFQLEHFDHQECYELKKNPLYWEQSAVSMDNILISKANGRKAMDMFQKEEIDWLGCPFWPWEPFFPKPEGTNFPLISTYWYVFNVKQFPFQSKKLRKAFACAIDRQEIVDILSYPAVPAFTPLPLVHSQLQTHSFQKNFDFARNLFEEGLQELGIDRSSLPVIKLICVYAELRQKIAEMIVQRWKEVFEIPIHVEIYSFKELFLKMTRGEYQIGVMNWMPLVNDPLYTLDIFKSSQEHINFSKWEDKKYCSLLKQANTKVNNENRNSLFAQAEEILINEVPVIPIFHGSEPFIQQKYVEKVSCSKIGRIDFKYTRINREVKYG